MSAMEVVQDRLFLSPGSSPKREREEDTPMFANSAQSKRMKKAKANDLEKDRTRGRYACLGHRLKHKRCPMDCPERRQRPTGEELSPVKKVQPPKGKPQRANSKKHLLKLDEPMNIVASIQSKDTLSSQSFMPLERDSNWDTIEWQSLSWEEENCLREETESWMDLKSSSHWEESKARGSEELPSHYNEEEIVVDSWLNDDGFNDNTSELDGIEGSAGETGVQERRSSFSMNFEQGKCLVSKVLVTREMMERWLSEPYFNSVLKGCFVRVRIGEYDDQPIYRIAHIDEVIDGYFTMYSLEREQTMKGLTLQVGSSAKKIFPIMAISNRPPVENDFKHWLEEMEKSGMSLNPQEIQEKEEMLRMLQMKYPIWPNSIAQVESHQ